MNKIKESALRPKRSLEEQMKEDFNAAHLSAEEFANGYGDESDNLVENDDLLSDSDRKNDEEMEEIKKTSRH
jgi:type IV secretory pathway VirD2 relaxase